MKLPTLWIEVSTHDRKRNVLWLPRLTKSNIVYDIGDRSYLSPVWEICWLCFMFSLKCYHLKQIYKTGLDSSTTDRAAVIQERVNELEAALREHRSLVGVDSTVVDRKLWAVLRG